jgi:hypothetical protein
MTSEQKAAFIRAQTALMEAEACLMEAANKEREANGYALAYGPEQWADFLSRWESILGYNSLISFFRD